MGLMTGAKRFFLALGFFTLVYGGVNPCAISADSAGPSGEEVSSKYVSKVFCDLGLELLDLRGVSDKQVEQAMMFLAGARELNPNSERINEAILNASQLIDGDEFDENVYAAFDEYAGYNTDLEVTRKAVLHLLEGKNTREEREKVLSNLLQKVGNRNKFLKSELLTQLGILSAEKAQFGVGSESRDYLLKAISANPYNQLAFTSLNELLKKTDQTLPPSFFARYLRTAMTGDPLDMEAALLFARYANHVGIYDIASDAYAYCSKLYKHLNMGDLPDRSIYLPFALSSYHSESKKMRCLAILNEVRNRGIFDFVLESIAGLAALKMSDKEQGERILAEAGRMAEDKLGKPGALSLVVTESQIAWFYSFVSPDPVKALKWAKKAYENDPDSEHAQALLGYALAENSVSDSNPKVKLQKAKDIIGGGEKPLYEKNQIAAVAMGLVRIAEGDMDAAGEVLQLAVYIDEESFAAEKAESLLKDIGREYQYQGAAEMVRESLENLFPDGVVPEFTPESEIISAKLSFDTENVDFGEEIECDLVISNNWTEPMVISDNGLYKGYVRVDARVSGDVEANISELVSMRFRPGRVIEAGGHYAVELDLMRGSLRRLLLIYPQADLNIEFTVYLDPVAARSGELSSAIEGMAALSKTVKREGVDITKRFLMGHFKMLNEGTFDQRVRAGQLFTSLFREQYATNANGGRLYRLAKIERYMVVSAIVKNVSDKDWRVRCGAICSLVNIRPPIDFKITRAVSENMNDSKWPVRMAALYMLSGCQGDNFSQVIDWKAKNDPNEIVRRLAIYLGGEGK